MVVAAVVVAAAAAAAAAEVEIVYRLGYVNRDHRSGDHCRD